jgi:diguanylate cyclase
MKSIRNTNLGGQIQALLDDERYQGHPLRESLAELFALHQQQLARIERITRISDHFQANAKQENASLTERFDKSLRQLERITRISDRYQSMLQSLNTELKRASTHDQLTGLGNRRLMIQRLDEEATRQSRTGQCGCVALIDVDLFKGINDHHGHLVGDQVLVAIANRLSSQLRKYDLLTRWGGEEFMLLMPAITVNDAVALVDRLREHLATNAVQTDAGDVAVTASFGIAALSIRESTKDTLRRADEALYSAKRNGRNRVEVA